jgi:hypothetical protein
MAAAYRRISTSTWRPIMAEPNLYHVIVATDSVGKVTPHPTIDDHWTFTVTTKSSRGFPIKGNHVVQGYEAAHRERIKRIRIEAHRFADPNFETPIGNLADAGSDTEAALILATMEFRA